MELLQARLQPMSEKPTRIPRKYSRLNFTQCCSYQKLYIFPVYKRHSVITVIIADLR